MLCKVAVRAKVAYCSENYVISFKASCRAKIEANSKNNPAFKGLNGAFSGET